MPLRSFLRSFRVNHAPPPAHALGSSGGSMLHGIALAFLQGMAVSAVFAAGPRIVDARRVVSEAAVASAPANSVGGYDACNAHMKAYQDCVDSCGSDSNKCQFYLDMLTECSRNGGECLI